MKQATSRGLVALAQDSLATLGIPGGSTLGLALQALLRSRVEAAREILLSEIKRGEKTLYDIDDEDGAAILFRYVRAAQEGTARLNLRLMARVINGLAGQGTLTANEFLSYADMLASLRYDEIVLLATLYRHTVAGGVWPRRESFAFDSAMTSTKAELVPRQFATTDDFMSTAAAAMRTGLIIVGGESSGLLYTVTPLMHRLQQMAPFEAAMREAPSEREAVADKAL